MQSPFDMKSLWSYPWKWIPLPFPCSWYRPGAKAQVQSTALKASQGFRSFPYHSILVLVIFPIAIKIVYLTCWILCSDEHLVQWRGVIPLRFQVRKGIQRRYFKSEQSPSDVLAHLLFPVLIPVTQLCREDRNMTIAKQKLCLSNF